MRILAASQRTEPRAGALLSVCTCVSQEHVQRVRACMSHLFS
jgi:hypothetical protein